MQSTCRTFLALLTLFLGAFGVSVPRRNSRRLQYQDPDENRNASELIRSRGYPVEEHVVNSDGYLLALVRIPYGKSGPSATDRSKVVYFQHGIITNCDCFVLDFPDSSLPYILADLGYDVWLGNYRGNSLCKKHVTLSSSSPQFWNFGVDELALIDLPNMLDFVLSVTEVPSLYYIGHSQGTLTSAMLLSEKPEYNQKIRANIYLAPVSRLSEVKTPFKALIPAMLVMEPIILNAAIIPMWEFSRSNSFLIDRATDMICRRANQHELGMCAGFLYLVGGFNPKTLNASRLNVYSKHVPDGTSTKNVIQLCQMLQAKKFQKYDYGRIKNRRIYNQDTPPEYDPKRISAPTALFVGANDYLVSVVDTEWLWSMLPNRIQYYLVPDPDCTHYDFVISLHAKENIFPAVIDILKRY